MRSVERVDFPFVVPLEGVLVKGAEEDGRWIVYLEASNELKDQDGETVSMDALKKAADYYLTHGVISWDHKHKQLHDPEYIIGEPLEVKFTEDRKTLVKGWLYQHNEKAKKLWNNIRSGAKKLGASIGGGILQKAASTIKQVIWDETALTHKPVNDGTLGGVQLMPFAAFAKALECSGMCAASGNRCSECKLETFVKALTAGSGVNAAEFTGGRALTAESLQGSTVKTYTIGRPELDDLFKSVLDGIVKGHIREYNDLVNHVLDRGYSEGTSRKIIDHVAKNLSLS